MNLLKTFSKYAVGSLVTLVVGFLSTMILTRLISTEEMGKYSMFITVGGLVSSFLYLGLDQSYVRFYYDEDEHSRVMLLKKCMVFPMLLTAGASVLLLLSVIFSPNTLWGNRRLSSRFFSASIFSVWWQTAFF